MQNTKAVDHAAIRRDRLHTMLPAIMEEQKIDAWLTFTREGSPDPLLPHLGLESIVARAAFLFARKRGAFRAISIAASYDVEPMVRSGLYDEVIPYRSEGVAAHLKPLLEALDPGRIAVNSSRDVPIADGLTAGMRAYLEEALSSRAERFVSAEGLVVSLLGRKLPLEIEALVAAAEATQRILAEALTAGHVVPGRTTEKALDDWMRARAAELGYGVAFGSVVVGPTRGHSEPTDRVIEPGDVLRTDWGASCDGYCADIQRLAYVLRKGETAAPAWLEKLWAATLAANRAATAMLVPGRTGHDADRAGREAIVAGGYSEFPHGTGHPIGLKVHDVGPMLGPDWPERYGKTVFFTIEAGQVFAVEPMAYIAPPELGYEVHASLEEDVLVGPDGPRYIGRPQTSIILI